MTSLTNEGQKESLVQSAMVLRLYGHIACVLAVKNMPVASPTCVHTSTLKRQCNADLCTNTPNCLAAADKIPCMQQMQTPGDPCVHAASEAQGIVAWQDTSLRRKLLWNRPCCTTVCTHQPKHREKASSHPSKNLSDIPDHYCRCSSGSSILLLWTLTRIAPCSHRNREVHL